MHGEPIDNFLTNKFSAFGVILQIIQVSLVFLPLSYLVVCAL
jgi:hypothetical protein